jgi:integrase
MTVTFKLNHPKHKDGNLKTSPVAVIARAYSKETGLIEVTTGEKVIPKYWTGTGASSKMHGHVEINQHLRDIQDSIIQLWRDNKDDLSKIKALLPVVVRGQALATIQKKRLFEAFDKFLDECRSEKAPNTLKMYLSLKEKLTDFDKHYPIDFETLDFNFYDRFKKYLYGIPNPNYKGWTLYNSADKDCYYLRNDRNGLPVGLFDDTVFKYFTNLKAFISWSEKRGYQVNNSHKTWQIIKRKHPPISLTSEELDILSKVELPKHLDVARDYLLLECYTGQRISDIIRFDQKDYCDYKWTLTPKKGDRLSSKTVTVHFVGYSEPALYILGKYNFKLPKVSEQKINQSIKEACRIAGINESMYTERWSGNRKIRITGYKYEFISTHSGRKTFITLALSHGMPVEYIMELTGISEYQTLSHYRAKFEDSSIENYLKKVSENIAIMRKAN